MGPISHMIIQTLQCQTWTENIKTFDQMSHYHTNMAAMIQLGKWFDYLREMGVYDNTRIIVVSDHGQGLGQMDELIIDDGKNAPEYVENYYPLLMVKDFDSTGFTESDEFMTNANVPSLAVDGLIENPVNPFTGKAISMDEKYAHEQLLLRSGVFDVSINNGNTFLPSKWVSVKDDIWNKENWSFWNQETVLSEHKLP